MDVVDGETTTEDVLPNADAMLGSVRPNRLRSGACERTGCLA